MLVVIQCLAYNQEDYIEDTLKGFVMQKTDFPFVAIVHDDASTDRTADIIREYEKKYPDIIKPIYETENQYRKGGHYLMDIVYGAIKQYNPKYVAMCEGDDYWTDPDKLQKQVDFMEARPYVAYTCHRYKTVYGKNEKDAVVEPNLYLDTHKDKDYFIFDKEYPYSLEWITKTLTCLYRYDCYDPEFLKQFKYGRDLHLVYQVLCHGYGACMSFVGGAYRISPSGVTRGLSVNDQKKLNYLVYKEFYDKTKVKMFRKKYRYSYSYYIVHSQKKCYPTSWLELKCNLYQLYVYAMAGIRKIRHLFSFEHVYNENRLA